MMSIDPRYSLSGFGVGVLVGLTGVGGGSLMTPILVLLFGFSPTAAVGTDLLYASVTKATGTIVHGAHASIDWRIVKRLAVGSVPATMLTVLLLAYVPEAKAGPVVTFVLGLALILTAVAQLFHRTIVSVIRTRTGELDPGRVRSLTIVTGVVLGILVSMSSVGAGALGMTALLLLYPTTATVRLVGSDIAHAVPLTLLAGLGHWWLGSVNFAVLASLLVGSIPGIIVGSLVAPRLPDMSLRVILAVILAMVGGRLVS